ncbi:amine sulfotransferase-like [Lissotriton helveticus]
MDSQELSEESGVPGSPIMAETGDSSNSFLIQHRGHNVMRHLATPEYIDPLYEDEIRDTDVFQVTYPKSGTVWMQQILTLIYNEGYRNGTEDIQSIDQVPWIEYNIKHVDHTKRPSPRLITTHLTYDLVPKGLREKKGKVIYIHRNPKDILTSLHHFSKALVAMEAYETFEEVLDQFLAGNVTANSWFDHVKGWYEHSNEFNILFLVYEEMVKDLKTDVLKICDFLGQQLDEEAVNTVVERATFKSMTADKGANYKWLPEEVFLHNQGRFLRKGKVGDWKNIMTVAQNEKFDTVFQEKMKALQHLPIKLIWDYNN